MGLRSIFRILAAGLAGHLTVPAGVDGLRSLITGIAACCARAASGHAAALSSMRNWRRFTSSMGSSPEPAVPAYSRLRMSQKRPQVLGLALNRSESSHFLFSLRFLPKSVPTRHLRDTLGSKGFFATSVPNIALSHRYPVPFVLDFVRN